MEPKTHLTKEYLSNRFDNVFDLVNYAIKLAHNKILSHRDCRVEELVSNNQAVQIIAEIAEGQDFFEEIVPREKSEDDKSYYMEREKRED